MLELKKLHLKKTETGSLPWYAGCQSKSNYTFKEEVWDPDF